MNTWLTERQCCRLLFSLALLASPRAQTWNNENLGMSLSGASATIGTLDVTGAGPIGPGTILTPPNPVLDPAAPPGFKFRRPLLGLATVPRIVGPLPNRTVNQEVDALSYVVYSTWIRVMNGIDVRWLFSVDQASLGTSAGAIPIESALNQHAADVYRSICPNLLIGPAATTVGCNLELDADGFFNNAPMLGVGLRDLSTRPDDLDALANVPPVNALLIFHSLATVDAQALGISGADIHWYNPIAFLAPNGTTFTAGTRLYAGFGQLGLVSGDNVDAIVVFENTITGYQASSGTLLANGNATNGSGFYVQWQAGSIPPSYVRDRIFFSVHKRSPVIGLLDSRFNLPIQPGDILEPPAPNTPNNTPPRIVVMAEHLGMRTDRVAPFTTTEMDDMDALEYIQD